MKRLITIIAALGIFAILPGKANADLQSGMFRLHLESTILSVGTGEQTFDADNAENNYSGLTIGAFPGIGIGLAGTLGRGFVLGGRVTFGLQADDWSPGGNADHFLWSIVPYLEYVFLTGLFRPFVTAELGMMGMASGDGDGDNGWWGIIMGGGGGAHLFVRDNISLDITLMMSYRFGTGDDDTNNDPAGNYNHWRFAFDTMFGLSAWF